MPLMMFSTFILTFLELHDIIIRANKWMHTGVIEILIITELKYVRIPTYVVEIYTPEKNPFLHRIISNWKEKRP